MTRPPGTGELGDVQSRIPRQSEGVDLDARFSAEVAAAVSGARRRAVRDGDRQIDTAHLLHSLLDSDAEARALLGDGPLLARLLGYLVQRSIGYGLRWRGAVEDSGAVPAVSGAAGYSPLAAAAVEAACARAARRGAGQAGWAAAGQAGWAAGQGGWAAARQAGWAGQVCGADLLAALVADSQARAVEVLARAAVEPREVLDRVDRFFEATP